jgi:hypothetical protein
MNIIHADEARSIKYNESDIFVATINANINLATLSGVTQFQIILNACEQAALRQAGYKVDIIQKFEKTESCKVSWKMLTDAQIQESCEHLQKLIKQFKTGKENLIPNRHIPHFNKINEYAEQIEAQLTYILNNLTK